MTLLRKAAVDFLHAGAAVEVFPVRLPQETAMPAITVSYVSDFSGHVHTGPSGLKERRLQVDIFATDHDTADELAETVQQLMDGYRGPWGDVIDVGHCLMDNDFDADEPETRIWRRIQDYLVAYNERNGS